MAYVNRPKVLVAREGYHAVFATSLPVNGQAGRLESDVEELVDLWDFFSQPQYRKPKSSGYFAQNYAKRFVKVQLRF
jgi:hypothetical protein